MQRNPLFPIEEKIRNNRNILILLFALLLPGCALNIPEKYRNDISDWRKQLNEKFEEYSRLAREKSDLPNCPAGADDQWMMCFGRLQMVNGDMYVGEFGKHPLDKSNMLCSNLAKGKLNGIGVYLGQGGLYYGQFIQHQQWGLGRTYSNDYSIHVGMWSAGRRQGDGIEFDSRGVTKRAGRWEYGKLITLSGPNAQRLPFQGELIFPKVSGDSCFLPSYVFSFPDDSFPTGDNRPTPLGRNSKLQVEVMQKEREQAEIAARQAEEKRLKARLAELDRKVIQEFKDDLPSLLAKLPVTKPNANVYVFAVGIDDYADVPDVPFADRSAKQFSEVAQKLFGAPKQNVVVLTNAEATSGRLRGRLRTILNRLGPQDQLLFYYAGHGVPGKNGRNAYLLAQDGGPGSYEEPDLQLEQLYAEIAKSRVGKAKLFIDACFSGRVGKDAIVFEGIAPITVSPKQSFPDSNRLAVLTAGRGDQFSNQSKERGHRLFSYHLMRGLLEGGSKLEMAQLHNQLRDRVLDESRRIGPEFEQEPDLQGNGKLSLN